MTDETDTTTPLTMPPGFRWVPNPGNPNGRYGSLKNHERDGTRLAYGTEEDLIKIANEIVRPAVEAATAELRAQVAQLTAERDEALVENYETALELERWQVSHPWSIGEDGDPVSDPHVVRCFWEASERDLRARAERAEARIAAALGECGALEDGEGADYVGQDTAFRRAASIIRRALGDAETLADRGEGA